MGDTAFTDQVYLTLLQLEKEARHAESVEGLGYVMVNRARILTPYRQAVLFRQSEPGAFEVQAISDVPTVDVNAPFVRWLARAANALAAKENGKTLHDVDPAELPGRDGDDASNWLPARVLWCPLAASDGALIGALMLARDEPWREADGVLIAHLTDAWGHAWRALEKPHRRWTWKTAESWHIKAAAAAVVLILLFPVSQTALAPAEVVAHDPELVAAPMDGVIKAVHVVPNAAVAKGDLLFSYDDTTLSGRLDVAEEELSIALAALRTARQGAFNDPKRNAEVALLVARADLSKAERDYISAQVQRKDVRAGRNGVAVFRDAADLEGRPVRTGERVMLISEPHNTELRIELPVADAVVLEPGSPVRLFLDRSPLNPVDAVLEYAAYEAEVTPSGVLSFRLVARFVDENPPRVGLRGTAKVESSDVPLFLYLFRRPLSALRQLLGI